LEHRLKDEDCVKARVAEDVRIKGRTVDEAFAILGDAVRFTFQYPEDRYAEDVAGDLEQLAAQGFTQVQRVNFWTRLAEHKGIVSCWREPRSAVLLEVQFHTRPSFVAATQPSSPRRVPPRRSHHNPAGGATSSRHKDSVTASPDRRGQIKPSRRGQMKPS
jgi:hypothetical protein